MPKFKVNPAPAVASSKLRIEGAAQYLNTTEWAIRQAVWEKKLACFRIGARILFDKADLDRFAARQRVESE